MTPLVHAVTTPVSLEDTNRGSLDQGEQVRWQFDIPKEGTAFNLQVNQGRIVMYASTQTSSPSEAFYEWKAETSSSTRVFIKPTSRNTERTKRNTETSRNQTTIPVYMALTGLDEENAFALESGELLHVNAMPDRGPSYTFCHSHRCKKMSSWCHCDGSCSVGGCCVHLQLIMLTGIKLSYILH